LGKGVLRVRKTPLEREGDITKSKSYSDEAPGHNETPSSRGEGRGVGSRWDRDDSPGSGESWLKGTLGGREQAGEDTDQKKVLRQTHIKENQRGRGREQLGGKRKRVSERAIRPP